MKTQIETTDYNKQALDFLNATNTSFTATYKRYGKHFSDDDQDRCIFRINLKNEFGSYNFDFGQSIAAGNTPPTAYDVLACLTKYDVGSFKNFCDEFGYDTDSRKAYKIYKAVDEEFANVQRLFKSDALELLQEIQ